MAELTSNASIFPDCVFGTKAGEPVGKSVSTFAAVVNAQIPLCPCCGPESLKVYRDGLRYNDDKTLSVQRWLCTRCGLRFSVPLQEISNKSLNTPAVLLSKRQICAKEAKNLSATELKTVAGDLEKLPQDAKGLLTKFMAYLERENLH